MSVTLTISDELLRQPRVAEAVQAFILSMASVRIRVAPAPTQRYASLPPPSSGRVLPPVLPAAPSPARPQKLPKTLPPPKPREPPPPKVRKVPTPKIKPTPLTMDFPEFEASLPVNSQRFLALVRERGVVRVEDVIERLGLETPKAVGGITGAISRWAPVRGVSLPYETITIGGERAWRWHGAPLPEPPPPKAKVKKQLPTFEEVVQTLSAPARKLLDAVRDAVSLGINDAVVAVGVTRAAALSGVLAEIREATEAAELKVIEDTVDMRGSRIFRWLPPPPPPAATSAADDADKEYATDGVIRRRRKLS